MKYLDKEHINEWAQLPPNVPAMPTPPTGYDRWHYAGKGVDFDGPIDRPWGIAFTGDREWKLDWEGTENYPQGYAQAHYIVAVRDQEARRCLMRLREVALKLAHTLSPIDAEVWGAIDDATEVLQNEIWELKQ